MNPRRRRQNRSKRTNLISYKYNTPKELIYSPQNPTYFWIPIILFIIIGFKIHPLLGIITLVISIVVGGKEYNSRNQIILSSSYLILGDHVIYLRTITELIDSFDGDQLILKTRDGSVYSIAASRFTTNARKEWKIKKNQMNKFLKISGKIKKFTAASSPKPLSTESTL